MPSYKLIYFNGMGRGEVTRYLFAIGDVTYEDVRLTGPEWQQIKPSSPIGSLPMLEVDGDKICQSRAIEHFVAKKVGRIGKSDIDEAHAMMIIHCIEDALSPIMASMSAPDDKKKEMREKYCKDQLPANLQKFETLLDQTTSGLFIGDDITWPDLALYQFVRGIPNYQDIKVELEGFPRITGLVEKVEKNTAIDAWIKKRPQTEL